MIKIWFGHDGHFSLVNGWRLDYGIVVRSTSTYKFTYFTERISPGRNQLQTK